MAVKCIAPLNNLAVSICSEVPLAPLNCVVVKLNNLLVSNCSQVSLGKLVVSICGQVPLVLLNCVVVKCVAPLQSSAIGTSDLCVCQVRCTSDQPRGFHLQSSAAGTSELRGCQVRRTFEQPVVLICNPEPLAPLNCMVVKCVAPLNNLVASICSQVPVGTCRHGTETV